MNDKLAFSLFVQALGSVLKETEGIIIHHDGCGYIVFNEDGQIHILEDDSYLNYNDRTLTWMHDEPVGNA
jgi:hypothetical protein